MGQYTMTMDPMDFFYKAQSSVCFSTTEVTTYKLCSEQLSSQKWGCL